MKFLVLCSGLYANLAADLSDGEKNTVWYLTITESVFPKYAEFAPGHNFQDLKKVRLIDIYKYAKQADCIVSFDTGCNGLIEMFRKIYPEKSVFGAGLGEKLETDRVGFKELLKAMDLQYIPYEVIIGFDALRKYLKANPKKVVKAEANFRGDFETICVKDYDSMKQVIDDRQALFGPYSEQVEFVVEDMVECIIEAGFDGFFSGGEFKVFSVGIEFEKNLYIGRVNGDIADVIGDTLEALKPVLKDIDYRGALSTEERIVSKKESYFIDPCCRCPMPLGVLYSRFINNWAEVVYKIGKNEPYEIECDVKYVGAYALSSASAKDNFTLVQIEKGHEDEFRFEMATQDKDGRYYSVKGLETVVVVVAGGDSPEEVVEKLKAQAENVDAFNLETDAIKGIDGILEKIKLAKTVGIKI